jgi:hypothetical protein
VIAHPLTEMNTRDRNRRVFPELGRCVRREDSTDQYSFTFLYVDDVRTSLETQLWALTTC